MDPIALILAALVSGVAVAAQETAGTAIKDAYQALKTLLARKLEGNEKGVSTLTKFEENPETWKGSLREELAQVAVDKDEQIVRAAQKLMELVNPQQAAMGKYNVQIAGKVQGLVQGDNANVTMNFDDNPDSDG